MYLKHRFKPINILLWLLQIFLNMYCNEVMDFHDGTCCRKPEMTTTLQIVTFAFLWFW